MKLNKIYLIVLLVVVILYTVKDRFIDFEGIDQAEKNIYHKVKNVLIPGYLDIKTWLIEKVSVIFSKFWFYVIN